jgi:general secretion pathway protein G
MSTRGKNTTGNGFTLLELLIAVAILGLITAMALPSYREYVDRTNNGLAIADIGRIDQAFELYLVDTNSLPPNLAAVGLGGLLDPWDNPYFYLRFDADTKKADKPRTRTLTR